MAKYNLYLVIEIISLAIIASGCTGGQDVTSVVKALPEVQQFMNEHPNAQITVTYWSKEEVAQYAQEISQQCDKPITPVAMYKATISEGDLKIISWINAENQIVLCSTTTGSGMPSQITPEPIYITPEPTYITPEPTYARSTVASTPSVDSAAIFKETTRLNGECRNEVQISIDMRRRIWGDNPNAKVTDKNAIMDMVNQYQRQDSICDVAKEYVEKHLDVLDSDGWGTDAIRIYEENRRKNEEWYSTLTAVLGKPVTTTQYSTNKGDLGTPQPTYQPSLNLPAGFPTNLPAGTYSITSRVCTAGYGCTSYNAAGTATNTDIYEFSKDLTAILNQAASQCTGSGVSCTVRYSAFDGTSFTATYTITSCYEGGGCISSTIDFIIRKE